MKIIIVGHTGQDGSFLLKDLIKKNNTVFCFSSNNIYSTNKWIPKINPRLSDYKSIKNLVRQFQPNIIYYLAAFQSSSENFEIENEKYIFDQSYNVNTRGLYYFLKSIKNEKLNCRLFYPSSSLIFDNSSIIKNEESKINPQCIYSMTKFQGMLLCNYFREIHNIYVSVGMLFNHESNFRKDEFISKKIVKNVALISMGIKNSFTLGNLNAKVDWSYAGDFTNAFQKIMKLNSSAEFIIASSEAHTVREFVKIAFDEVNLDWKIYTKIDKSIILRKKFTSIGNTKKLRKLTNWKKRVNFESLVKIMVRQELINYKKNDNKKF